jgi:hypothetical protein
MAKCASCGANVGCSCNLNGGLCTYCAEKAKKENIDVNTKTN